MPKTVFYARVSTRDQNLNGQVDAAHRLGIRNEHIFVEKASGARHDRPQLVKALGVLQKGDTLACFKLDRIGRSLPHLVSILEDLGARGINFVTTEDGLSTKGSTGKFVLQIMAAVAQFERSLMLERTRAGLAAAKRRGTVLGRRRIMEPADIVRARKLMDAGEMNSHEIANLLKVSRATMFRELRKVQDLREIEGGH